MTNDRIAEIKARLAKLPKEPWSRETHDVVRGDNRYGSDPYNVLLDDDGKVIADSMNSDLRCIEGNCDDGFIDSGTLDAFELFLHAPDDMRALLAQVEVLTSPPAPSGWQPIESAPKVDGARILGVTANGHLFALTWIADSLVHKRPVWMTSGGAAIDPTHWMPEPPPPGQNAKDALPPAPPPDPVEAFYSRVNARVEADMLNGRPVTGAHHRALETEIAAHRSALPPAPDASPNNTTTKENLACSEHSSDAITGAAITESGPSGGPHSTPSAFTGHVTAVDGADACWRCTRIIEIAADTALADWNARRVMAWMAAQKRESYNLPAPEASPFIGLSLAELAERQGVKPIRDIKELQGDVIPDGVDIDAELEAIRHPAPDASPAKETR